MNRIVLSTTLAGVAMIATAAGMAIAQPPAGAPEGPPMGRDVTRQEVINRVDEVFSRLDANRDGRVTPDERRAAREQRREAMVDRAFDRLDADNNGSISREEMRDGRRRGPGRRMRMAGPGGPGGPGGSGFDGPDGPPPPGMRGPGMRGPRGMGAREVTREEMRERALARFDRMDANRDGTVTVAERRQARDAMRERMRMRRQQDS